MKNLNAKVVALVLLFGAGTAAAQGIYRQQDADGRITYTDRPEAGAKVVMSLVNAKAAPTAEPGVPVRVDTAPVGAAVVEIPPWQEARRAVMTKTRMTSARALQIDLRESELRRQREEANRTADKAQLAQSQSLKSGTFAATKSPAQYAGQRTPGPA